MLLDYWYYNRVNAYMYTCISRSERGEMPGPSARTALCICRGCVQMSVASYPQSPVTRQSPTRVDVCHVLNYLLRCAKRRQDERAGCTGTHSIPNTLHLRQHNSSKFVDWIAIRWAGIIWRAKGTFASPSLPRGTFPFEYKRMRETRHNLLWNSFPDETVARSLYFRQSVVAERSSV